MSPSLAAGLLWLTLTAGLPDSTVAALNRVMANGDLRGVEVGNLVVRLGRQPAGTSPLAAFALDPLPAEARADLFARNPEQPFTPASSLKLCTAAAALDVLGAGYRFTTRVAAPEPPRDGVVSALYLIGGGDPSLDHEGLRRLVAAVQAAGVRRIDGPVIGDTSRYRDRTGAGWTDDDRLWYYGAEVTALTLGRNQVDLYVLPGASPGSPAKVWWSPANTYVKVANEVVTARPGQAETVEFGRVPGSRAFRVTGRVSAARTSPITEGLAVPGVEVYAAHVFTDLLEQAGIAVTGEPTAGRAPADAVPLARHESPPLAQLLQRLLKRSDNLYAELFLREVGVRLHESGSAAAGVRGVTEFMARQRIDSRGLRMFDGSGLSRWDLVAPRTLAGVLRAMALHGDGEAFIAALPIAGVDGTLARRMAGTAAQGVVRAKTGYLRNHTALAGYVSTRGGDVLIAVSLFSGGPADTARARALHDRVFVTLAETAQPVR